MSEKATKTKGTCSVSGSGLGDVKRRWLVVCVSGTEVEVHSLHETVELARAARPEGALVRWLDHHAEASLTRDHGLVVDFAALGPGDVLPDVWAESLRR